MAELYEHEANVHDHDFYSYRAWLLFYAIRQSMSKLKIWIWFINYVDGKLFIVYLISVTVNIILHNQL